ncbi:MAG: hypothetical protein JSS81_03925 [Acidobacteria bacterium]|nr:hypothetical protein [Acidobacteriota bacterium]
MYSKKIFFMTVCAIFLFAGRAALAAPGDLDPSFGENGTGLVITRINHSDGTYGGAVAYASVVQPDDKIIAVGSVVSYQYTNPASLNYDIALVRYNPDGTLDSDFGSGGKVVVRVNSTSIEEAFAVALQPDDKIVVAGYATVKYSYSGTRRFFALFRFNPDGTPDYSFGIGGKTLTEGFISDYQNSGAMIRALVIQPDEKILAAGIAKSGSGDYGHTLIRYNSNGSIDTSFNGGVNGGRKFFYVGGSQSFAYAAAQQSTGEIIVGGYARTASFFRNTDFSAIRFNSLYSATGIIDSSVLTHFFDAADDRAYAVAVQPDDKFILAGETVNASPAYSDFALARYNADGTRDNSFGYLGRTTADIGGYSNTAFSAMVQSDGKIVAAGNSYNSGWNYISLARFNPDGSLDLSFGSVGRVIVLGLDGRAFSVKTQSDGRIITAGTANSYEGFALARYEN